LTEIETNCEYLLDGLRRDIAERRIRSGLERLDAHRDLIEHISPEWPGAAQLVWRVAQWVDAGWANASVVGQMLQRFAGEWLSGLPLRDYAAYRMALGMLAADEENLEDAIGQFNTVLVLAPDIGDCEIAGIANYWKARCLRKKGEYDDALKHTAEAYSLVMKCGNEKMAGVMRVLESWLYFQKGRHKEALKVLSETETVLNGVDDSVVLGNIQSTYGRIYRQEGRHHLAIEHFTAAIAEFRKVSGTHPHLARTLANLGYVERLVALQLKRQIDEELTRKRRTPDPVQASLIARHRQEFETHRDEALAHLDEAESIYRVHPNHRGSGTVCLNRGLLHLDNGALEEAEEESAAAFALGSEKDDPILMARARILQCLVENAKLDEGIEEDGSRHAQTALDYIREALEFAHKTQNRRLLARAHTWHGLTLLNDRVGDRNRAIEAMNMASSYLDHAFHDTAWEDLRTLKARLSGSHSVDETLRAWSHGAVGDRTFRQLTDEFAAIVIPKVWEIEGRKIARVANRLSISPKKVRRILSRAGLLGSGENCASASVEGE
jgi:tetratricopeptide (TPR) repeat protein